MARVTWLVLSEVSTLPLASSTATFTAGVMTAPAPVLEGPWTKPSLAGGPIAADAREGDTMPSKATARMTAVPSAT